MGLVVDRDTARTTGCHGYQMDGEKFLWSPGVIGMLSDPQEKIFCKGEPKIKKGKRQVPKKLRKRWKFFKKSAAKCSRKTRGKKDRLPKFLSCMSEEAASEGIEV